MDTQIFFKGKPCPGLVRYVVDLSVSGSKATVKSAQLFTGPNTLIDITDQINYARCNYILDDAGNAFISYVQIFCNGKDITNQSLVQTSIDTDSSSSGSASSSGSEDKEPEQETEQEPEKEEEVVKETIVDLAIVDTAIVGQAIVGKAA